MMLEKSELSFEEMFFILTKRYEKIRKKEVSDQFSYEDEFQCKLYYYLSGFELWHKDMFTWAVPNGSLRDIKLAKKLKSTGMRSGVSDLMTMGNGKMFFSEQKQPKGGQSMSQKRFESKCKANGMPYKIFVSNESIESCCKAVVGYLYK